LAYPEVAVDGQRLSDAQNSGAVAAFVTAYGNNAGQQWAQQHNAAIGFTSDPNATFRTAGGVKTITDLGVELNNAGYGGPWNVGAMLTGYANASGSMPSPVSVSSPQSTVDSTANPTDKSHITATVPATSKAGDPCTLADGSTGVVTLVNGALVCTAKPPINVTGDFGRWFNESTVMAGVQVPNALIAGTGIFALVLASMSGGSRRRNPSHAIDYSIRTMRSRRSPGESERLARRKRALRQQRREAAIGRSPRA
jgi:hypothetical protein